MSDITTKATAVCRRYQSLTVTSQYKVIQMIDEQVTAHADDAQLVAFLADLKAFIVTEA